MTIQLKLFLFEKYFKPEWGHSSIEFSHYFLSESIEKLKAFLEKEYNIPLDNNNKFRCFYDRCEEEYTLRELECRFV